jgi:hypothetical protein
VKHLVAAHNLGVRHLCAACASDANVRDEGLDAPAWSRRADEQRVEDRGNTVRAELRRRARRVGLSYAASSLVIGVLLGLSRPWYGVMVGAVVLAGGLYLAFGYLPFAAWLRRREQSH